MQSARPSRLWPNAARLHVRALRPLPSSCLSPSLSRYTRPIRMMKDFDPRRMPSGRAHHPASASEDHRLCRHIGVVGCPERHELGSGPDHERDCLRRCLADGLHDRPPWVARVECTLRLVVVLRGVWPAQPVGVAQPARPRGRARTPPEPAAGNATAAPSESLNIAVCRPLLLNLLPKPILDHDARRTASTCALLIKIHSWWERPLLKPHSTAEAGKARHALGAVGHGGRRPRTDQLG